MRDVTKRRQHMRNGTTLGFLLSDGVMQEILRATALAVAGLLVAPQYALAQGAKLNFFGGPGIVCPVANALVTVYFFNRSGSSQTIEGTVNAPTVMDLDFPAPVTNALLSQPGVSFALAGKRVTVTFRQSVTVAHTSYPFLLIAYLDLRGVRSGTPIAVTVTTSPSTAVAFDRGVNTSVFTIADAEACQSPATSAFTIDDLTSTCPSAQEVAALDAVLKIRLESDPSAGYLVCRAAHGSADLTYLQERTYQTFRVMQFLPFDTPLPWTSKSLFDWFSGTIRGIRYRSDISGSFCCEPEGFINVQTGNLEELDPWGPPFLMNLAGLFVHEARHNELGGHTCGSYDKTLSELGAWAVQYYFNEWAVFRAGSFLTQKTPTRVPSFYRQQAWLVASSLLNSGYCDCGPGGTLGGGVVASPSELDFGAQAVFAASVPRSVAITSSTIGEPVTIREISLSGANAADFTVTGTSCVGTTLPPSCPVVMRFTPSAAGPRTAQLTAVMSNGLRRIVELRGAGGR